MKKASLSHVGLVKVGKVLGAHSLRGEVKVLFFGGDAPWIGEIESLVLEKATQELQNFEIEYFHGQGERLIAKFKNVDDRTEAETIKGSTIWIPSERLVSQNGDTIYLREIIGFVLFDGENRVGIVEGFESNEVQDLAVVKMDQTGEKALVPLVKDFIVTIDFENKQLKMKLPEGLLEINRAL